jgi:hypothetical protein
MNKNKIAHFFLNVDMRCNHTGLLDLLKKNNVTIGDHDFVVFLNKSRTMIKMFCQGEDVLLHYKKDGRVIDPGIIPFLPKYCGGKQLNVEGAIKEHLQTLMERRNRS